MFCNVLVFVFVYCICIFCPRLFGLGHGILTMWWSYEDCRGLKTIGRLRPEIFKTIWAPNARHTWKSVSVFNMPNHACHWVGSGCRERRQEEKTEFGVDSSDHSYVMIQLSSTYGKNCELSMHRNHDFQAIHPVQIIRWSTQNQMSKVKWVNVEAVDLMRC